MSKLRNRIVFMVLAAVFIASVVAVPTAFAIEVAGQDVKPVKNVIVLITDGTSADHVAISRWYQGAPLVVEDLVVAAQRTYSADSLISDSAPAASAFATGYKTNDKFISVSPEIVELPTPKILTDAEKFVPLATVLEAAELSGKSTGLIAISNIQHATPAAFSSHVPHRNDYNDIAEQQVFQGIEVVLGGGKQYLLPKDQGGTREDGANLVETLKQMGYGFVETTADMKSFSGAKFWGMFASDAMAYDFDRDPSKEPSLAEMTQKAIDILSKNPKGFFLFVEASKTDWASHANDPIGVISEVLAWDRAVKTAVDFAKRDKNTLVLAFSDHGNGGMTLGLRGKPYSNLKMAQSIDILKKAKLTGEGIDKKLNTDRSNIREVVAEYYGITD
ncbi:MAG: alkaline phosphatase, partial [Spirochaetota bacterium]